MDILANLKNTITDKTYSNLSEFLGEDKNKVSAGLHLSLNTFLASILKYSSSESEASKLVNVLNEGGHTGELLNNLETFTGNFDKSKLLVTIGNNIISHFFGAKSILVDNLADFVGIKKTSSASLTSIAAPIALGFLGKTIKENGLNNAGLRNLLIDNSNSLKNSLPTNIAQTLNLDTQEVIHALVNEESVPVNIRPEQKVVRSKGVNWEAILPWLVLFVAALGSLFYYFNIKKPKIEPEISKTVSVADSTKNEPKDFLPITETDTASTKIEEPQVTEQQPEISKLKNEEPTKVLTKPAPTTVSIETKNTSANVSKPIAAGWNTIFGSLYQSNSAEMKNTGAVQNLINKIGNGKIRISPLSDSNHQMGEDRAYALREALINKGLDENQIEISSPVSGSDQNSIVYKIIK